MTLRDVKLLIRSASVSKTGLLMLSHFGIVFPAMCQELLVKYLYAKQFKSKSREMFGKYKRKATATIISGLFLEPTPCALDPYVIRTVELKAFFFLGTCIAILTYQ